MWGHAYCVRFLGTFVRFRVRADHQRDEGANTRLCDGAHYDAPFFLPNSKASFRNSCSAACLQSDRSVMCVKGVFAITARVVSFYLR